METISHLIERLEKIKAKYGDKPVLVWTPNSDDLEKSEDCLFVVPEEYQNKPKNYKNNKYSQEKALFFSTFKNF